jgi:DNA-binding PadR family transcriptional regulator
MAGRSRRLTLSDLVVLSLLSEEPMHGYQLVSELERRDAKDWAPVSRPQVYYSISKLADMKLIVALPNREPAIGAERVQYKLSPKGVSALSEELARDDWATDRSPPPFLTWMALSSHLSRRDTLRVVRARREFLSRELERERETLKAVEADSGAMTAAARLMIGLTNKLFETELEWLDHVEDALSSVRK